MANTVIEHFSGRDVGGHVVSSLAGENTSVTPQEQATEGIQLAAGRSGQSANFLQTDEYERQGQFAIPELPERIGFRERARTAFPFYRRPRSI